MKLHPWIVVAMTMTGSVIAQPAAPFEQPNKLAFVLPVLIDRAATYAPPALRPFVQTGIGPNWIALNSSIAVELSNLPNPAPASAFRYYFDRQSGTIQRVRQSLGPVLAERAETLGKGSFNLAVTFQRFNFDRLDDLNLGGFQVATKLTTTVFDQPLNTVLRAGGNISLQLSQTTAHFSIGVTHWLDATYAFPIVSSALSLRGSGSLTVQETGLSLVEMPNQNLAASATGVGDGIIRLKAKVLTRRNWALGVAGDLRLPIGDEFNYHGAGAYGVKPFFIVSAAFEHVSPHLNVGYQWNGESYLGSQNATTKSKLPNQFFMAAGFDAPLNPKLSVSFDFLDQLVRGGQRTFLTSSPGIEEPIISFRDTNRHELNAAFGVKALLREDLIITGNLLVRLNRAGLRSPIVPLVGLSYLF